MKIFYSLLLCFLCSVPLLAQNKKFQVNGDARGYLFAKRLDLDQNLDTITPKKSNYGHTLIDLGFSIFPNDNTEIISSFRIRNELGGFWGSGVSFNVRQLTLRGVAGGIVKYDLGDIDLKMTPYTMWNYQEEGTINEAEIFSLRRKVVHYDLFYNDNNTWRMQGGQVKFGVKIGKWIKGVDFSGFFTRQRPTDGITIPERVYGGGTITWRQNDNLSFAYNSVNLFDLTKTINDSARYSNNIHTFNVSYLHLIHDNFKVGFSGEAGRSNAQYINNINPIAPKERKEWFFDASLKAHWIQQKTTLKLGFRNVGADFLSPGAQTKRVDFSKFPGVYQQFTNAAIGRPVNLTDIINHNAQYSIKISDQLMAYHVAYDNITPYGLATPNRSGLYLNAEHSNSIKITRAFVNIARYQETRGMGTNQKKSFISIAGGANVNVNEFLSWERRLVFNIGVRHDITSRAGAAFEKVNFSSTLIDLGLSLNIIDKLDLLAGFKYFQANGNEFVIERNIFNEVQDFRSLSINFSETTTAFGLRYKFSEKNQLLANIQQHNINFRNNTGISYGIAQFNILYTLTF
jgi:hypothetical protein